MTDVSNSTKLSLEVACILTGIAYILIGVYFFNKITAVNFKSTVYM